MLKRSGAILLTMLYTVTVFGFALNFHYCGKLLAGIKFNSPAKSCGMVAEAKMKCCKDKKIEVKVKDTHQSSSTEFVSKTLVVDVPKTRFAEYRFTAHQPVAAQLLSRVPPDISPTTIPAFIVNCTFRI